MCSASKASIKVHPAVGHLLNVRCTLRDAAHHNTGLKLFGMIESSKQALLSIGLTDDEIQRWDDCDDQHHANTCTACKPKEAVLAHAA